MFMAVVNSSWYFILSREKTNDMNKEIHILNNSFLFYYFSFIYNFHTTSTMKCARLISVNCVKISIETLDLVEGKRKRRQNRMEPILIRIFIMFTQRQRPNDLTCKVRADPNILQRSYRGSVRVIDWCQYTVYHKTLTINHRYRPPIANWIYCYCWFGGRFCKNSYCFLRCEQM